MAAHATVELTSVAEHDWDYQKTHRLEFTEVCHDIHGDMNRNFHMYLCLRRRNY
jgi:hypothetical protein